MRDILTGLALLLVVALTAALAGPHFIDWTQRRPLFEQHMSALLGAPVSIGGEIGVTLLPAPTLTLSSITIGDAAGGPRLSAEELDLEIAVMPLLRGDVRVTDSRLRAPRLDIALTETGGIAGFDDISAGLARAEGVAIEHLRIDDGVIEIVDRATGGVTRLVDIDAEADAQALLGPWRANGRAILGETPLELRLATGGPEAGGTRVKAVAQTRGGTQRGELDGRLSAGSDGGGRFDGRVVVAGRMRWPDRDGYTPRPWTFSSGLRIAGRAGKLEGAELEAGSDETSVKLTGGGDLVLGPNAGLALALEAKQIDLDRPYTLQGPAFLPLSAVVSGWLTAFGQAEPGLPVPWPLTVGVKIGNVILGGDTVSTVALDFGAGTEGRLRVAKLSAGLPGGASADIAGDIRLGGGGYFAGRIQVHAKDVARLLGWVEGQPGGRSIRVAEARDFSASGDVSLSPNVFAARNLRVSVDRSTVQGAMRYTAPEDAARGRFEAQLISDGLSIEQVPDISTLTSAGRGLDLMLVLDARNVRVGQTTGPNVGAGRVGLKMNVDAQGVRIDTLDIADVGGASVRASGHIGETGGRLEAAVDARKVEPVAELLRKLAPGKLPAMLLARAPVLGPLKLRLVAERGASAADETRFTVAGTAAASRIEGVVSVGGAQGADRVSASLKADAPDAAAFLAQLGFEALPLPGFGPGRLAIDLDGRFGAGATVRVAGEAAGTTLSGEGRTSGSPGTPDYVGTLAVDSPDVSPLLQILALPGLDGLGRVPFTLRAQATLADPKLTLDALSGSFQGRAFSGSLMLDGEAGKATGALGFDRLTLGGISSLALGTLQPPLPGNVWPAGRFGSVMAPPFDATVTLTARALELGYGPTATGFSGSLRWAPDSLELTKAAAEFGGGRLSGGMTLRRQGAGASLSVRLGLKGVPLPVLAPQSGLAGLAEADLDLTTAGEGPAALVSSLSGGGQLRLRDVALPRLAPDALGTVTARFDAQKDPPDLKAARDALSSALDKGPMPVGALDAPLTVSSGQARFGPLTGRVGALDVAGSANLDLRTMALDARAALVVNPPPAGWSGPFPQANVTWRSGRGGVQREVDVSGLTNLLTTRAVARELERIEAMESDLRERGFFARRLKVERELVEHERKAAEEARLAEEARQAEQARQVEEARRAAEARKAEQAIDQRTEQDRAGGGGAAAPAAPDVAQSDREVAEEAAKILGVPLSSGRTAPARPADATPVQPSSP